jgi:uncharacterized protein
MTTWHCIKNCGACCQLDPTDRPDLADYLTPEELPVYMGMVGTDGWCINFDAEKRECKIYDDRPRFCRVQTDTFKAMYNVDEEDLEDFAIDCCLEHIESIYGDDSPEMDRFQEEIGIQVL